MTSWKEGFYAALLEFVRTELGKADAVEVTRFEQYSGYANGGCDSCDHTIITSRIIYKNNSGKLKVELWEGDFGELISRLADKEG